MRILETIAKSLRSQSIHPTTVYNALIDLENNAGIGAIADLEYRLARLVRAMKEREDSATGLAIAWLNSTRAYLEQFGTVEPILQPSNPLHSTVLRLVQQKMKPMPIVFGTRFATRVSPQIIPQGV
ncbi:MAG: hypothetical protein RLZZ156_1125 [Deinococcota bacterium]